MDFSICVLKYIRILFLKKDPVLSTYGILTEDFAVIKLSITTMGSLLDLWGRTLGEIEIEVSKATYLTLFKNTSLLALENGVATIAAPSTMIIDLLERRFYQIIKKSLDRNAGLDSKIVFVPKTVIVQKEDLGGPLFSQEEKRQKVLVGHLPRVRNDYTFDNMAVSSTNQLAYVSATSVASKIGRFYNPLFIYGPVGVGKTHLMQAIANDVYQKTPNKKIVYITSEEFTNEVVEAIRTNATGAMKKKFRNLDLLIIDDVQFVAGKERVQEELFHTFNILVDNFSQVVLSSDRAPSEIKKVESRLLSRFSGGLTVDIETPDFELRTAILLIKAKKFGVVLPIEAAKIIAGKTQDARALEGILLQIITKAEYAGVEITPELVEALLENRQLDRPRGAYPEELIKNVCSFYKITPQALKGEKRNASLVRARQVAMFLLKKEVGLSFSEIGNLLGGRDHTTIMYGARKIEGMLENRLLTEDILGITSLAKNP